MDRTLELRLRTAREENLRARLSRIQLLQEASALRLGLSGLLRSSAVDSDRIRELQTNLTAHQAEIHAIVDSLTLRHS